MLKLFNDMKGKINVTIIPNIRLIYLNILINRKSIMIIIDMVAMHNFISVE